MDLSQVMALSGSMTTEVQHGGTLDVRTLPGGVHRISASVRDPAGQQRVEFIGVYDAATGKLIGPYAGL